jgi:hypothetical protein
LTSEVSHLRCPLTSELSAMTRSAGRSVVTDPARVVTSDLSVPDDLDRLDQSVHVGLGPSSRVRVQACVATFSCSAGAAKPVTSARRSANEDGTRSSRRCLHRQAAQRTWLVVAYPSSASASVGGDLGKGALQLGSVGGMASGQDVQIGEVAPPGVDGAALQRSDDFLRVHRGQLYGPSPRCYTLGARPRNYWQNGPNPDTEIGWQN